MDVIWALVPHKRHVQFSSPGLVLSIFPQLSHPTGVMTQLRSKVFVL